MPVVISRIQHFDVVLVTFIEHFVPFSYVERELCTM